MLPWLTALQNVRLPLDVVPPSSILPQHSSEALLEMVGLAGQASLPPARRACCPAQFVEMGILVFLGARLVTKTNTWLSRSGRARSSYLEPIPVSRPGGGSYPETRDGRKLRRSTKN
jgi:hypothetical protein